MARSTQFVIAFVLLALALTSADVGPEHTSWSRTARSLQQENVSNLFKELMKQLQTLQSPSLPPPNQVCFESSSGSASDPLRLSCSILLVSFPLCHKASTAANTRLNGKGLSLEW